MLTTPLLSRLTTDAFWDEVGFIPPPAALRRLLQRLPDIRRLRGALRYGVVVDSDVRRFVGHLLEDFRPGEMFLLDLALSAIAVALEHWDSPFAEEYLHDLARIQRVEFATSARVARSCLKARYSMPLILVRTNRYPVPADLVSASQLVPPSPMGKRSSQRTDPLGVRLPESNPSRNSNISSYAALC